ncbi:UNVERIFIED_CONTAM: hypothetical protein K2H54_048873 [Gekko kuhli]
MQFHPDSHPPGPTKRFASFTTVPTQLTLLPNSTFKQTDNPHPLFYSYLSNQRAYLVCRYLRTPTLFSKTLAQLPHHFFNQTFYSGPFLEFPKSQTSSYHPSPFINT